MRKLIINSLFAIVVGGIAGNLISNPHHTPRLEVPFRLAPERSAPRWISHFVKRFQEKNGRLPSQSEMESLGAQEFGDDVRRMKLTWLGEVRWSEDGRRGNILNTPAHP
jgi:hypothetical protein